MAIATKKDTYMNTKQNLGWIGVGKMGTPMATNLLKAGYKMTVFDIVPAAMKTLVDQGANPAESPLEVAEQADIIISMIPDDAALEEISTGALGIFQGSKQGVIYIDMSTVSPATSARIGEIAEKKGIQYLRAPVSGSTESAVTAALTILAHDGGHYFRHDRRGPCLRKTRRDRLGPDDRYYQQQCGRLALDWFQSAAAQRAPLCPHVYRSANGQGL
jgi:3-hydroxyisobutyrate dehydrogenase